MRRVRWGILSTAKIGRLKVIPAMQQSTYCEIAAISSRDPERAEQTAQQLQIPHAYGSYQELLEDKEIDAVYIPLPNHLHVPWALNALAAGKHVLCEKPVGLTAEEGVQLLAASRKYPHLKIMEAFMYRHHPQWVHTIRLVKDGKIGQLRSINAVFSYCNTDAHNIRNQAEIGGGGLMDIGCYCISLSRMLFAKIPERVTGTVEYDDRFRTDQLASGLLDFNEGTATFTCATQLIPFQRVNIFGTKGRIEIEIPFNAPPDKPCRIWFDHNGTTDEVVFDICDQYTIQGDLFSRAILENTPVPVPLEDAVDNMRVIEAVIKGARDEKWIHLDK